MNRLRAGAYARVSGEDDRSPARQQDENCEAAEQHGWEVEITSRYSDEISASRYAAKPRPEWALFSKRVRAGDFDIAILWEPSRGSRELENWAGFLNDCLRTRTRIYITSRDRLYDMENGEDYRTLALDGVDSMAESDKIKVRTRSGIRAAAKRGGVHARIPYGYKRWYEDSGKRRHGKIEYIIHQEPDAETAPVVRDIFERLAGGEAISAIFRDLNARGIPAPTGRDEWGRAVLLSILRNRSYIARRVFHDREYDADWPAIVDDMTFSKVQAILNDPARRTTKGIRPGKAKWLLSYIATCSVCGYRLQASYKRTARSKVAIYRCGNPSGGHVTCEMAWLDEWVTDAICMWAARPQVFDIITRRDNSEADFAHAELVELDRRLAELKQLTVKGRIKPEDFADMAADIERDQESARARMREAAIPPAVRELVEAGGSRADRAGFVRQMWDGLPVATRRRIVMEVADRLRLRPAGSDRYSVHRIDLRFADRPDEPVWAGE